MDIQSVHPTNDPVRIERYVKDLILKLGDHNGGLVAWPYSEPAVIEAGEEAARLGRELFERLGDYALEIAALR